MRKLFLLLTLMLPVFVFAHEGHGHTEGFTIIHYLTEAQHLIALLVVAAVLYMFYKNIMKKQNKA